MAARTSSRARNTTVAGSTSTRPRMSDDELRNRGMMPYLRPEHVSEGESLRLTGFNNERANDGQIVCEVENREGKRFNLGIRKGSPDHRVMHHQIGPDFTKWNGHVTVVIGKGRTAGHPGFVNVADASRFPAEWDNAGGDEPPPHGDSDA